MQSTISKSYLGLSVSLAFTVTPSPAAAALTRDDAGERVTRVLAQAAGRCSEILAVAVQDVVREALTAAAASRQLPVIRVDVGHVGRTLDARLTLADDATDDQRAAADILLSEYAAAHAAQE